VLRIAEEIVDVHIICCVHGGREATAAALSSAVAKRRLKKKKSNAKQVKEHQRESLLAANGSQGIMQKDRQEEGSDG
jgi:phosphatidate phosphatase APP1